MQKQLIVCLLLLVSSVASIRLARAELPLDSIQDDGSRGALRNIGLQLVFQSYPAARRNAETFGWNVFNLGIKDTAPELGYALALQAVAEVYMGIDRDALWHWESAQLIVPELRFDVMRSYGEIVSVFDGSPFSTRESAESYLQEQGVWLSQGEKITPPRALDRVSAPMPHKRSGSIAGEKVTVSFIVGTDGRVYSPRVESSGNSALATFSALQVLNRWIYEPGQADGVPKWAPATASFSFQKHK